MERLLRTGSQSCGSCARRVKFSSVYCGGSTCVVHVPSRAKATSTIIACGRMSTNTNAAAMNGASVAIGPRSEIRVLLPFPVSAYERRRSNQRSRSSAAIAVMASTVVSTYAIPIAPLSFEATTCVESTRSPPPKMYGAEKEPSALMNTSNIEPASAGVTSGSVTLRRRNDVEAPSPAAASSSVPSSRSSPADTKRKT